MSPVKDRSPDIAKYPLSIGPPVEVRHSQQSPPSYPAFNNNTDGNNVEPNLSSSSLQVTSSGRPTFIVNNIITTTAILFLQRIITVLILTLQVIVHLLLPSDYPLKFLTYHMIHHHILLPLMYSITQAQVIHILIHHKNPVTKSKQQNNTSASTFPVTIIIRLLQ